MYNILLKKSVIYLLQVTKWIHTCLWRKTLVLFGSTLTSRSEGGMTMDAMNTGCLPFSSPRWLLIIWGRKSYTWYTVNTCIIFNLWNQGMGGEMRCWSGQNKLLSAKKYNRTFFLYGDFYFLPIYNLLNFKFLKKKIPPFLLGLETFRQQLKTNKFISMDGLINCL